ncbi:hypothetical protein POM88_004906 [Heracleum sosnowskyi]|uniref:Uncharacterized protein n=1 Tax=Heracleum sosnowskyi TaxID=360622 RepID=A0AAD8NEL5_9APIA|nr:hypothetical protein POM88_004906 [Heracleum sosnowskyi]
MMPYPGHHNSLSCPLQCTDCAPIFLKAYEMRNAGALGFDWSSTGHGPLSSGGVCRCLNNGRAMRKETIGFGCVTELFYRVPYGNLNFEIVSWLVSCLMKCQKFLKYGMPQVYIYSSSSRGAQRLLFSNSTHGDRRKYICGYFGTTIRTKTEAKSYLEILETIGVDKPEEILLVTSDIQAAMTARAVG